MPQNSNFRQPSGHRLFPKNGSYGYGAKSRRGPPRGHLGANGVPLGPKYGSKPLKITMPQNSSFRVTRSHRFFTKNGIYGFEAKWRWGHPRGHLGANRVPLGPKNGLKRRKLPCPKILIFDDPAVIDYSQKMGVTVLAPNHGGDLLGSILGPMGSHWEKKGQNRKKLQCPKNSNFRWPRGHRFFAKNGIYGFEAKSRWGHPRGHLGANRVPLGPKNGSKRRKLPCPKILIFDDSAVIDYSQKMEVTVMAPNHDGDPLGAILGPMGSHWFQEMGQNIENYLAQNSNFRRPRGHRFFPKNGSYGYGVKSWWGPARIHLGANGVQLGKKNGSKP